MFVALTVLLSKIISPDNKSPGLTSKEVLIPLILLAIGNRTFI